MVSLGDPQSWVNELDCADDTILTFYGIKDRKLFIADARAYLKKCEDLMAQPTARSYMHADTNFGNFIFSDDGQVHFLDTWWGAFSVAGDKSPRGIPAFDVEQVKNRLWYALGEKQITQKEYTKLCKTFEDAYSAKGTLPIPEMAEFCSFLDGMLLLGPAIHWFHAGNTKYTLGRLAKMWVPRLEKMIRPEADHAETA